MKRTLSCRTRKPSALLLYLAVVVATTSLMFTDGGSGLSRAAGALQMYFQDFGKFPRHKYTSTNSTNFPGAPGVELLSLDISRINPDVEPFPPMPRAGQSWRVDSFFDVFTEVSHGGLAEAWLVPDVEAEFGVSNPNPPGGSDDGPFDLELRTFTWTQVGGPFKFRTASGLASLGGHSSTPLPDGMVLVDSFFDVFVEISLDDGATWHAAAGPMHLELTALVPEPATIALAILGLVGLSIAARRYVQTT